MWGGHEGSFLLWCLMLSVWMVAVSVFSSHLPEDMVARVLGVMGLMAAGFLAFMLFTSNPFDRLLPAAPDGRDLNPLLQDPGMVLHPPMLYMGYVGLSVAFSLRGRGAAFRPPRRRLGALVAAMDHGGLGIPHRSASRSAAAGPTTSSAGAAGGSGTRWRTRPSCPGSSPPRSSIRSR